MSTDQRELLTTFDDKRSDKFIWDDPMRTLQMKGCVRLEEFRRRGSSDVRGEIGSCGISDIEVKDRKTGEVTRFTRQMGD